MDSLVELLATIQPRPLGTIVHIGAGRFAAGHYEHIEARQIVLVEGDPQAAAVLKRATDGHDERFEVVAAVVAPAAGPVMWHRYNVRMLNGPVRWSGLDTVYPRLRCVETLELGAVALDELLSRPSLAPGAPGTPPAALVLDVPQQESDLLPSLSPATLRRFRWVALRMRRRTESAGAASSPGHAALVAAGFVVAPQNGESDPQWPVRLYRFERELHARHEAERQLELLRNELKAAQARADDMHKKLSEAEAARVAMQAQLAERDARQRLLDAEILKAEAQLQLVKDVLLREKNF